MAFPPPGSQFLQNLSTMALINMNQPQYQITPMGGMIPMHMAMSNVPGPHHVPGAMGITLPTGVTTISAPPVRKILQDHSSLSFSNHQSQVIDEQNRLKKPQTGTNITVFVGNISDRASDMLIRQLLSKCGTVMNWKRVQGANGKLQAFGFCEYSDPESAMVSIRLLHEFDIGDKKLVVKVDAKTKEKLDEYLKSKNPSGGSNNLESVTINQHRLEDDIVKTHLIGILREHELELSRSPDPSRDRSRRVDKRTGDILKSENLADLEMEEEKRSLIHREIDKFRDTYKNQEDKESDKEKGKDAKKDGNERDVESGRFNDEKMRDKNRIRSRDRTPVRDKSQRKDRERFFDSRIERSDERTIERGAENDEELYERRRLERKLREKEVSYQERLRNWESREIRKNREHEKEVNKQMLKKEEECREIRRLKQFLEDYDDSRYDNKFYKGSALHRRSREYQKEREEDERDSRQEKRELEELRKKLAEEGHPDPEKEARKRLYSNDVETEREKIVSLKIKELMNEARSKSLKADDNGSLNGGSDGTPKDEIHVKSFTFTAMKIGTASGNQSQGKGNSTESPNDISQAGGDKRKKFSVQDVFNPNDDEDDPFSNGKKRKLPSLIDENTDSNQSTFSNNPKSSGDNAKSLSSEDKRKQIKSLIEKIPTSKEELFQHTIDWSVVDNSLMEKRIRPWINKKITEYIGEEEQALLDFICSKISAQSSAQSILDDVAMVLDEEAEVFIVKMWRLLIYEIEAKKLGLGK